MQKGPQNIRTSVQPKHQPMYTTRVATTHAQISFSQLFGDQIFHLTLGGSDLFNTMPLQATCQPSCLVPLLFLLLDVFVESAYTLGIPLFVVFCMLDILTKLPYISKWIPMYSMYVCVNIWPVRCT